MLVTHPPGYATSSNQASATGLTSQKHLGRCSDGTILAGMNWTNPGVSIIDGFPHSGADRNAFYGMFYSKDKGVTWTQLIIPLPEPTGAVTDFNGVRSFNAGPIRNFSFFVDQDDCIHLVYAGFLNVGYYSRGVPNGGRTAWTWSNAFPFSIAPGPVWPASFTQLGYASQGLGQPPAPGTGQTLGLIGTAFPDVIAHRNVNGPGWYVHLVQGYSFGEFANVAHFVLYVDVSGNITWVQYWYYPVGEFTVPPQPSIEMRHIGDGKTVTLTGQPSSPDVYLSWGDGNNYHYRMWCGLQTHLNWGSGSLWNDPAFIFVDGGRGTTADGSARPGMFFDGTHLVAAGLAVRDGFDQQGNEVFDLVAHDINPYFPGGAVTHRVLATGIADQLFGTVTYDAQGNIYFVGTDIGRSANIPTIVFPSLAMRVWNRTANELGYERLDDNLAGSTRSVGSSDPFNLARAGAVGLAVLRKDGSDPNSLNWIYCRNRTSSIQPAPYTPANPAAVDLYYGQFDLDGDQSVMVG